MHSVAGILFDKDGTLLDFAATWGPATAAVLAELSAGDAEHLEALAELAGFDHRSGLFHPNSPVIAGDPDSFAPDWAARLGIDYDKTFSTRLNRLFREHSLTSLKAFEEVGDVLDALIEAGFSIGLATNDAEENARAHLLAIGVIDRFSYVAGYDSGHGAKPGPGMVRGFADAIGVTPSSVAMVGDTGHDMAAARAAGALAIGIARDEESRAELAPLCDILIDDLGLLVSVLKLQR
jgi:phosphoglycolate phosphatase